MSEVRFVRVPQAVVVFLKGVLMGIADIIPGVSGGTLALITGVYEQLIQSLRNLNARFIGQYGRGDREGARESLASMDLGFLGPLLIGTAVAILAFAPIITWLLDHQAGPTYAFFFGLILASAGFVMKYVERLDLRHLVSGSAGFLLVVLIVGMEEVTSNHTPVMVFVAGAIAIGAMLLPGISGSLVLLIVGQYEYMLEVLSEWSLREIIVFGVGAVTGVLLFSRVLHYLLEHHRSMTMAFLFGCMVGALRLPAEIMVDVTDTTAMTSIILLVVCGAVGFVAVYGLEHWSDRIRRRLGIEVD